METLSIANPTRSSDGKGRKEICPLHRGEDRNRNRSKGGRREMPTQETEEKLAGQCPWLELKKQRSSFIRKSRGSSCQGAKMLTLFQGTNYIVPVSHARPVRCHKVLMGVHFWLLLIFSAKKLLDESKNRTEKVPGEKRFEKRKYEKNSNEWGK